MESKRGLVLVSLSAGYGLHVVVKDIDMAARPGEVTGIVGGNGSGKSTLLKAVVGIASVASGQIVMDGAAIARGMRPDERVRRMKLSYTPQVRMLFDGLTVEENLQVVAQVLSASVRSDYVEKATALFPSIGALRRRPAEKLSGGERKIVALAGALSGRARLLLLDEPIAALAPDVARATLTLIKEFAQSTGAVVVLVEHRLAALVDIVDRLYILRRGAVSYEGGPDILEQEEKLAAHFL